MFTRVVKLLLIVLFSHSAFAQTIGHEWIRSYQPYYKVKIAQNGVYRITSSVLSASGVNFSAIHPRRFQLFRNGKEIPVFIQGDADNVFNNSDYIEFYGQKNDGELDTELYPNPADQPYNWVSLFNDTAVYFLTILPDTSVVNALRYTTVSDNNFGAFTPEPYFIHEERFTRQEEYVEGINLFPGGEKYNSSEYTDGEGWSAQRIGLGATAVYQLSTPFKSLTGPAPIIEAKIAGVSDFNLTAPIFNHHVVTSVAPAEAPSYTVVDDRRYKGYITQKFTAPLTTTQLGNQLTNVRLQVINDLSVTSDFNALLYVRLTYARQYILPNATQFEWNVIPVQSGVKTRIQFQQYGDGSKVNPLAFDLKNNKRIRGAFTSGSANLLIDNTGQPTQLVLFDSTDVVAVSALTPVVFPVINPSQNYQYLIVTHQALASSASEYELYRSQKFNVLKVFTDQLYDYYTYGQTHPLAIRRFAKHLLLGQTQAPQFLLLLGKGYQNNLIKNQNYFNLNLVPAIGVPASDVLFTNGITGTGFESDIPTGRIAAANNQQVLNYLDKLKYYETTPDSIQEWRKHILHVSGGDDQSQQSVFRNQLNLYGNIIRGKSFGAKVLAYGKTTNDAVQSDLKDVLQGTINRGISMMSFLGHGSATILDVKFGSLQECTNQNKYPLFYFNGCNIGNPSDIDPPSSTDIYGRDFVCAANKGAIGWLAHSNITLDGKLYPQMNAFYQQFSNLHYGEGIGKIVQEASRSLSSVDQQMKSHCIQLTYQGDPAVKIYSPTLPDLSSNPSNVFFTPAAPNASLDSFAVSIIVTNFARAIDDTFQVALTRVLQNGTRINSTPQKLSRVYLSDTLTFWVKSAGTTAIGNNTFEFSIDASSEVDEANENNNFITLSRFIPGSGVKALLPYDFAIVNTDSVELIAQNNDLFTTDASYTFELDTTLEFNSVVKQQATITSAALAKWKTKLSSTDTTVYYWRVKLNNTGGTQETWDDYSFTHIPNGTTGWAQRQFNQYFNSSILDDMEYDTINKQLRFVPDSRDITVKIARWWHGGYGILDPYASTPQVFSCIPGNGLVAIVYDKRTLEHTDVPGIPRNCVRDVGGVIRSYYAYDTRTTLGQQSFIAMVDSMESGSHVALYSFYDAGIQQWNAAMRLALQKLGSFKVAQVQSNKSAFVLLGQKDAAIGSAIEDTVMNDSLNGQNSQDPRVIQIEGVIRSRWHTGSIFSKAIGPARQWQKLHFYSRSLEAQSNDKQVVSVYAVNRNNIDSLILLQATSGTDISWLNASLYPYVKIKSTFIDSLFRTPNQFGQWMITYQPPTEGVFQMQRASVFHSAQLEEGDSLRFSYGFENIGSTDFDSLDLQIEVLDANRQVRYNWNAKTFSLAAQTWKAIEHRLSTAGFAGKYTLNIAVNGQNQQPEQSLINNFISRDFEVKADKKNPQLDVTFDGYRILNGDYVSATPFILISSKDDNTFRLQKDTSTFTLMLKRPNSNAFETIHHNEAGVQFYPASNAQNKARLEYKPITPLSDGMYTLRVQSKDAAGNAAGRFEYEIDFKVENKSSITHFFPYPNPGTTNIRFVFTLTGSKIPDQLLIRIMTISGKIIREIRQDEFGPIKIGQNISQFAWDGTDEFGDRLANGVYLYQVYTKIEGNNIERKSTKADQFFLHDTGKIYLMR